MTNSAPALISSLSPLIIDDAVARALREDLGDAGDITTAAVIPSDKTICATITSRQSGVIAGVDAAIAAFRLVDSTIKTEIKNGDGYRVQIGERILSIEGRARGVLSAERVALNFLGHLSGVATATAALVEAIKGCKAKIVCTRKTTPGLRALEKHAVLCGGGANHRFGLYDAVMIKDNHIAVAGGIIPALRAIKRTIGHMVKIEIEVDTLEQLETVLSEGVDVVLLDNMSTDDMAKAVTITKGRCVLEASGNVTLKTVSEIANTGVNVISSGWITHSAPCLDLGLDVQ